MVESLRRQKPVFPEVQRPAEATDRMTIALEGRIDGEIFPGGQVDELKVVLGAGTVLAELDAALRGMQVGEEKEVPASFPEDYGAKAVAGKDAMYKLWHKRIEAQSPPELDEAFLRDFGVAEGGVPEFRAQVRASMEKEVAAVAQQRMREQLLEALHKGNPLELPRVLVEEQIPDLQRQVLRRMGGQRIGNSPPGEPSQVQAGRQAGSGPLTAR